jgi:hypothetical protein
MGSTAVYIITTPAKKITNSWEAKIVLGIKNFVLCFIGKLVSFHTIIDLHKKPSFLGKFRELRMERVPENYFLVRRMKYFVSQLLTMKQLFILILNLCKA